MQQYLAKKEKIDEEMVSFHNLHDYGTYPGPSDGGCRQCTGQGPIALGAHEYTHVYCMYSVLASYPR